MMSLQTISSAGGAGSYYSNSDNYYFVGELLTQWHGKLAEEMGLEGSVDVKKFTELLEGKVNEEKTMGKDHRPGVDMTFSAPKSLSVLALVGKDERLLEAFKDSVYETIPQIEKFISTRVTKDKETTIVETGKGIFASFIHDTNRNLDPQLHMHVINMNLTEHEGEIKSLSSDYINKSGYMELIYKHHTTFGQMQRNILEEKVKELGYEIEHKDKGLWEIKDFPEEVSKHFSSRSQEIKEAVGESASFESRNVAALDTRSAKVAPDKETLTQEWNQAIKEHGFDMDSFISQSKENGYIISNNSEKLDDSVITDKDKEILNTSISNLSNRKRDFSYNDVLIEVVANIENVKDFNRAELIIEHSISAGNLIPLESDKTRFTSVNHLLDEKTVNILAEQHLKTAEISRGKSEVFTSELEFLKDESISIINSPSTYKNIRQVVDKVEGALNHKGNEFYIMTPTAARKNQVFVNSNIDKDKVLTFSSLNNLDTTFSENSTLVIDSAERLSAKDAVALMSHATENNLQVVLINTTSRESNTNIINIFENSGVSSYSLSLDDSTTKLNILSEKDKPTRLANVAREYITDRKDNTQSVVVAANAKDKDQLTKLIREQLISNNIIDNEGEKVVVETRNDVFLSAKDKLKLSSYDQGMVIEDRSKVKRESFTITKVNENNRTLTLTDSNGESKEIKPSEISDKSFRVFNSNQIEISVGERLKHTAAMKSQDIKAKDYITITDISEGKITGVNESNGKEITLYANEPLYGEYGYVSGVGEVNKQEGKVIVPLSKRDLNANNINALRMSGDEISIHSPLNDTETLNKVKNLNIKSTITDVVLKKSGSDDISLATDILREGVESPASLAVSRAIEGMKTIGIEKLDLIDQSLRFDKNSNLINAEIDKRIQDGRLISVTDSNNSILVPKETYEIEKDIVSIINKSSGTKQPLLLNVDEEKFDGLTSGQKSSIKTIITTTDAFTIIQGYAGVGKTTKLHSLRTALVESLGNEIEIRGLGPTHRAVGEMQDVGIEAQTLKSFNLNADKDVNNGIKADYSKTLFIIDETSMVGNADMRDAISHIYKNGGRASIMGDKDQFLAIESGTPFNLVQENTNAKVSVMIDIVRQTNLDLKQAVYDSIEGRASASLNKIQQINPSSVPRIEGKEFPENSLSLNDFSIATDYLSRTKEARDETLIITGTNGNRRSINEGIQKNLLLEETLSANEKLTTNVLIQQPFSRTDLNDSAKWTEISHVLKDDKYYQVIKRDKDKVIVESLETGKQEGWSYRGLEADRVEAFLEASTDFYTNDKVLLRKTDIDSGKKTNDSYTIQSISDDGVMTLKGKDGIRIIDPKNNIKDKHIDLGYAVTSTGAQGASSKYVIGYLGVEGAESRLTDDRAFYITISRAKEHVQLYTDAKTEVDLVKQISKTDNSVKTAHELLSPKNSLEKAQLIASFSKPIDTFHAGRVLLEEFGLNKNSSELSLLSRTKNSPLRITLNNFDENGKFSGITTFPLEHNRGNVVIGEAEFVSENHSFSIVQKGINNEVLAASDIKEGLSLSRDNPESSVVILNDGAEISSQVLNALEIDIVSSIDKSTLMANLIDEPQKHNLEDIIIDSVNNSNAYAIEYDQLNDSYIDDLNVDSQSYQELYDEYLQHSNEAQVAPTAEIESSIDFEALDGPGGQEITSVSASDVPAEQHGSDMTVDINLPDITIDKVEPEITLDDQAIELDTKSTDTVDLADIEMTLVDRASHHLTDLSDVFEEKAPGKLEDMALDERTYAKNLDKEL
ncbi:MobF family relaxase [Rosenbergiella collisarenosi]|uniref:MobF family relaxase n=1 Tax=Rosenbergiella collisarenosi TaxID=1544695 RepID=UPI001F4EBBAA|nr:MobF family relaxase [Rosenbergiella collisarenosi]